MPSEALQSPGFVFNNTLCQTTLSNLYSDDYVTAEAVFSTFEEEIDAYIGTLQGSFLKRNLVEFSSIVHKIKPVYNYVGLTAIYNRLLLLEDDCKMLKSMDSMTEHYEYIISETNKNRPLIKKELERLKEYNKENNN
jgi:HPt (histidine-containing phosphotransfer) domain-containing protein